MCPGMQSCLSIPAVPWPEIMFIQLAPGVLDVHQDCEDAPNLLCYSSPGTPQALPRRIQACSCPMCCRRVGRCARAHRWSTARREQKR